jgi:hypothetical protein
MNPLVRPLSGFGRPVTDEPSSPEARLAEVRLEVFMPRGIRQGRAVSGRGASGPRKIKAPL